MQKILDFLKKNREVVSYLFFGGLTFIVSMVTFWVFNIPLKINALYSNIISWIFAVLFAYITNRIWVFKSNADTFTKYLYEIFTFFSGRLLTLGIEELIIFVFVTVLDFNSMIIKAIAQIVVIVSNYVISKIVVFRKK